MSASDIATLGDFYSLSVRFPLNRKKRCSGGMPCAACVNFNRNCCIYDRSPSSTSSRVKESNITWNDRLTPSIRQTPLCFTTKVLLQQVKGENSHCDRTHSHPSVETEIVPFLTLSALNDNSSWSQYNASCQDPSQTMTYPSSDDVKIQCYSPTSSLGSPFQMASQMSRTISLPSLETSSWSQPSTPSSLSSPVSPSEELTAMLNQPWFHSPQQQPIHLSSYELQEKDTLQLLQSVDALLEQLGGIPTAI